MTFVRRFSFITLLALSALGLGAHLTQAACSIETEGGYPAQIVSMSNSLSADQNTLTVNYTVNAGGGCDGVAGQIEYELTVSGSVPGAGSDFDTFSGSGRGLGITGSLSIGVGALSNGSYTVTLTATGDTPPPDTQSQTFTINRTAPLSVGSCSGSPNPATTGSSMTWSVPTPTGGTGSYTYAWSGTDSLSGSTRTVSKTYSTTGTKNASVIVTSGAESATKNCSITANAPASSYTLSVSKAGTGSGTVTGTGINCGADCSETYTSGTSVTLSASPTSGTFTGWSGACTGTGTCSLTMNANKSVTATFDVGAGGQCNSVSVNSNIGTNWLIGGDGLSQALYSPGYPAYVTGETYSFDPGDGGPLNAGSYGITADTPAGYNPPTISPSANQNCPTGGSITFTLNYTTVDEPPPPPPGGAAQCTGPTALGLSQNGTFSGSDGASHSWSASGGSPSSGSGASFTTKWASGGNKVVYMDGASGDYCTVCVGGAGFCSGGIEVTQQLDCQPNSQSVTTGQSANFAAYVNSNAMTVNWSATGGTPSSATRASTFSTVYGSTGNKTVNVSKASKTIGQITTTYLPDSCAVTVTTPPPTTGTVVVTSNLATTWSLSGPDARTQVSETVGPITYEDMGTGLYTLTPADKSGMGYSVQVTPGSSQSLVSGATLYFNIEYAMDGGGTADVDIKADGSDGPALILSGTASTLTWTSSGIVPGTCVASGDWSGNKADESVTGESTGALTTDSSYTITCDQQGGGQVSDSVGVNVRLPQCSDGIDNADAEDSDADAADDGCWTDPEDPNTYDPTDDNETYAPQVPGEPTECSDDLDNDGDGLYDFDGAPGLEGQPDFSPDDGCTSLEDNSEKYDPDIREI